MDNRPTDLRHQPAQKICSSVDGIRIGASRYPPQRLTTGPVQNNQTTSDLYRAATSYHRKPVILEPEALPFGPGWSANLKLG